MMTGVDQEHQSMHQQARPPLEIVDKQLVVKSGTNNQQPNNNNNTNNNSFELVFCKVCNQPTVNRIRCGVLACEACKKFFQRNRENADTLRCVSGTFDCPLSDDRAALTSSGTVWRLVCPRCRLAKCLAVGMRVLGRKTKSSTGNKQQAKQKMTSSSAAIVDADQPSTSTAGNNNDKESPSDSNSGDGLAASSTPGSSTVSINKIKGGTRLMLKHGEQGAAFSDINNMPTLTPAHQKLLLMNIAALSSSSTLLSNINNNNNNNNANNNSFSPSQLTPTSGALNLAAKFSSSDINSNQGLASSSSNIAGAISSVNTLPGTSSLVRPNPITPGGTTALLRTKSPMNLETVRQEELLNLSVHAARDLSQRYESLPLRANIAPTSSELGFWQQTMHHYEEASRSVMSFANKLPYFEQLSAEDRCLLYANSISPLSTAQNLQAPAPFGMNLLNSNNFSRFFPEFSYSNQEAVNMNQTLNAWNPSAAEYSLLMSLLLYQSHPNLSNPGLVQDIATQLKGIHQSMLSQEHPNNPALVAARIQQLAQMVEILRSTTARRVESFESIKARRPDLLQVGRLYNKVYSNPSMNSNSGNNSNNGDSNSGAGTSTAPPPCQQKNNNNKNNRSPPPPSGSELLS